MFMNFITALLYLPSIPKHSCIIFDYLIFATLDRCTMTNWATC